MAKLFGCPINVEAEEEGSGGGSSIAEDGEAMSFSGGVPRRESNRCSDSGSGPMDLESDLQNCFIDFLGRDSYEIATVGREFYTGRNQMLPDVDIWGGFDVMEEDIELGLGIGAGAGSGSGITGNKEIDSGRVEVGMDLTPFEDDLFCEEEAMLMADEELEWENLQNGIPWESEPVQASVEEDDDDDAEEEEEDDTEEEEEEEEEEGEELALLSSAQLLSPVNNDAFVDDLYEESLDILVESLEGTDLMDLDYGAFLDTIHELGENHGDYDDFFAQTFNQEPPIMGIRPASKRVVDDLPVVDITSEELSKGNVVCAVCIGDFVVEEKVTRLPCRHYYHGECILTWLRMKNTCPVCRYELPTDDIEYEKNRR